MLSNEPELATFDLNIFALLGLILAFVMTLVALSSYRSLETAKKRLAQREAELRSTQLGAQEFREKTSGAFVNKKSLELRIETLERSLALAHEQLEKERQESERLSAELKQLRADYETTKLNLADAYKRLREKP